MKAQSLSQKCLRGQEHPLSEYEDFAAAMLDCQGRYQGHVAFELSWVEAFPRRSSFMIFLRPKSTCFGFTMLLSGPPASDAYLNKNEPSKESVGVYKN